MMRLMNPQDIPEIVSRFTSPWTTSEKTEQIWQDYSHEQHAGIRSVGLVEKNGKIVGYGSLLRKSECPAFLKANIPEVNAVWIHDNYRKQGLGTHLIQWLEQLAKQEGYKQIGIGVGLYRDYGPAQQLYFKLGYVPDGNGITYKGQQAIAGTSYPLDDELILWLVKNL